MSSVPFIGLEKLDLIWPNYDLKKPWLRHTRYLKNHLPVLLWHNDTMSTLCVDSSDLFDQMISLVFVGFAQGV